MRKPSDYSKIEAIVQGVSKLTVWSPAQTGSALRVACDNYSNWKIKVNPGNIKWLYRQSQNAYECEWKETDSTLNRLVADASVKSGLGDVNNIMNVQVGMLAAEKIRRASMLGKFLAFDIGAGTGETTLAVISALQAMDSGRMNGTIVLIEPSELRLREAKAKLSALKNGCAKGIKFVYAAGTEIGILKEYKHAIADAAYSNAALHHNSFNFHLKEIHRVMKPGAPLVIGDWHNSMWAKPSRVYWLLALLQNPGDTRLADCVYKFAAGEKVSPLNYVDERQELGEFRRLFSLSRQKLENAFAGLLGEERMANVGIMQFWLEVGNLCSERGVKSPFFMLEGHEKVRSRAQNLKKVGFEFDAECRMKYCELLGKLGKGELATVMMAKKPLKQKK